jgi:hypothetical protein
MGNADKGGLSTHPLTCFTNIDHYIYTARFLLLISYRQHPALLSAVSIFDFAASALYMGFSVSQVLLTPTSIPDIPPPPIKPNTSINISGNAKLNMTADGLRNMDFKLALAMASVARVLLYFILGHLVN